MRHEINRLKWYNIHSFIHSFISNIYIAPLQQKLLRGSPNSSAGKKNSLQARKERERYRHVRDSN